MIKVEDDVVVEYAFGMLEDKDNPVSQMQVNLMGNTGSLHFQMPDPRKMQINMIGFMDKHGAAAFMEKLWSLLLSAQNTVGGVPAEVNMYPSPWKTH